MKQLDPASKHRTYEPAGAQFICSSQDGCDVKLFASVKTPRRLAGDLLEETGAWFRAVRDLPPEYQIPAGVTEAINAAYFATLAWVELLDKAKEPRRAERRLGEHES